MSETGWMCIIGTMLLFVIYMSIQQAQDYELQIRGLQAQAGKTHCAGEITRLEMK